VVALDSKTGEQLWEFNAGMGISGSTVAYSVGGKQYLATVGGGLLRATVWFGTEPKLADVVKKMNFGGAIIAFGLAE
jgi:alcohol dehydrogenase (cytochrome c)